MIQTKIGLRLCCCVQFCYADRPRWTLIVRPAVSAGDKNHLADKIVKAPADILIGMQGDVTAK